MWEMIAAGLLLARAEVVPSPPPKPDLAAWVAGNWRQVPAQWPLASRLQALQQHLHDPRGALIAALGDTDGDGTADLVVGSSRLSDAGETAIFRGADLARGK